MLAGLVHSRRSIEITNLDQPLDKVQAHHIFSFMSLDLLRLISFIHAADML